MDKTKTFTSKYGTIDYRTLPITSDEYLFLDPEDLEVSSPVMLDFIETNEENQGQGKKLIEEFIAFLKENHCDLIYMFAEYDPDNFANPKYDQEEGLTKLVKFYETLGFETFGLYDPEEDNQVDMYLKLTP